jgi:hypothetical protein
VYGEDQPLSSILEYIACREHRYTGNKHQKSYRKGNNPEALLSSPFLQGTCLKKANPSTQQNLEDNKKMGKITR